MKKRDYVYGKEFSLLLRQVVLPLKNNKMALFFLLIFSACSTQNGNIIYIDHQPNYINDINHSRDRIIMGENIIELSDFKTISCCFDGFLDELWIIENSNYEIINFYKIIEGEPVKCFSYDAVPYIVNGYDMFVFNNKALISFRENEDIIFNIFDLKNGKIINSIYSKDIIENNKDALLRPIGIRGNNLFFLNGYYNVETKRYIFFKHELLLPCYFSNENMILFCNNNYFALYNIDDENIIDLNIKIPDGYISNFYLDDTELYYSKIKHTWLNVILTLDYGPMYRHYYKYNILTKKNMRIKTPTEFVDIIGIIK